MFNVGDIIIAYGTIPSGYSITNISTPCKVVQNGSTFSNQIHVEVLTGHMKGAKFWVDPVYFKLYKQRMSKQKVTKNHLHFKVKDNYIEIYKGKKLLEKVDSIIVGNIRNQKGKEFDGIPVNKITSDIIYTLMDNEYRDSINIDSPMPIHNQCIYLTPKNYKKIAYYHTLTDMKKYLGY